METLPRTVLRALVLATCAAAVGAQDAQRDRTSRFVDAVDVDLNGDVPAVQPLRPVLMVTYDGVTLRAPAGAAFAIWAGWADGDDATKIAPAVVLACGWVDDDGIEYCALPAADYAGGEASDVWLQAAILAPGDLVRTSDPAALRRRPDDGGDDAAGQRELRLSNQLPANFAVTATLGESKDGRLDGLLRLTVVAPTTGFKLRHVSTEDYAGHTLATFELESPPPDGSDLPVLETLTASAELSDAGRGPIKVFVRWAAGAGGTR